ncbi:MAG: 1-(5-phosphoribosyl)-5-[(5-phosphoribosylamino)methylideneamino] imidazole-4-carboxamide isomerase [Gemmatimonadetes bacterium]|nr:1-(5-phosphoribosyl)-5-[(5-phosphoribosylamino)methylideneamino] imidazole-4-carboxamide isomerase [Gemmatimonadota bacterium]
MLAIPAIDLRDRHCVQHAAGDHDTGSIRFDDPVAVARRWAAAGFARLHVVDLDAATGRGDNRDIVRELLRDTTLPIQAGGGVCADDAIRTLFDDGADRVIIGSRGLEEPAWLGEQAALFPGRIILAADVRDRQIVARGWSSRTKLRLADLLSDLDGVPLAGLLVSAVHKEGRMQGTDLPLIEEAVQRSAWPVIASGGVGSLQDLRNLEDRDVAAVVLGTALYTGAIDPRVAAEEFSA